MRDSERVGGGERENERKKGGWKKDTDRGKDRTGIVTHTHSYTKRPPDLTAPLPSRFPLHRYWDNGCGQRLHTHASRPGMLGR